MELTNPSHPLYPFVWVDSGRMNGAPSFRGTLLPVRTLFDHLRQGPLPSFEFVVVNVNAPAGTTGDTLMDICVEWRLLR